MTDFISEFLDTLIAAGFEPKGGTIIADNKWHPAAYMGEKKKFSGAYSMKIVDDDFAIGCYFTRKDPDNKFKWHSKSDVKVSAKERKKRHAIIKKQQQEKEVQEEIRQRKISDRLTRVYKNLPKVTSHAYLKKKNIKPHKIKFRKKHSELIVPLYGTDGRIWTLQKITKKGGKYLFTGGRKQSSYFPICTSKEDLSVFTVCEGFATGASVREATKLPVIVALDSGNLKPVLEALKAKYPASKFIICADNDAFTMKPDKVTPWNPGIESAHKAAQAIGGAYVVHPDFSSLDQQAYEETKPTDFNDLHAVAGLDEVRAQIMDVVNKIPAELTQQEEPPASDGDTQLPDQHTGGGDDYENCERDYEADMSDNPLQGDLGMSFKVLGYNDGTYYYFPFEERQIVALSAAQHTLPNLFRLDSLYAWEDQFGAGEKSEKKIVMYATNALMSLAKKRGVFKEEDRVRGCGAWVDKGRKILHCGDTLLVDGVETKFDQLDSEYTYIAAVRLMKPDPQPLTNREAFALRQICEQVTWENKLSGSLLAGWMVIAPICGALPFRPHVYITGEAESGKSTVLDKIIKPVLGKFSMNVDGGTTEPAIRQGMGYDARPLVYDEAEKSNQMPSVLELARKASTGGIVKKFGQGMMKVRFCACFSAINPPVNKTADESRISFMVIKKNRKPTAIQEYNDLLKMIGETLTPEYSSRMLSRTITNIDTLFENIKIFQKTARKIIQGARASEMIGAMLAGLYLLSKTDVVTTEIAEKWISQHDWTDHTMIEDDTDPVRLLQYLSSCVLRIQYNGSSQDRSIGDLILMADEQDEVADKVLRYNGIGVKDKRVNIANRSHNLAKLLKDTDWSTKWTRMLSNIEGAEQFKMFYFSTGVKTSGVSLPIGIFTEGSDYEPPSYVKQKDFDNEIPF